MSYDFTRIRFLTTRNEHTEALLEATEVIGVLADPIRKKLQLVDELYDLENVKNVKGLDIYRLTLYAELMNIAKSTMNDVDLKYFKLAFK